MSHLNILFLSVAVLFFFSCSKHPGPAEAPQEGAKQKKVLLVGIDGLYFDQLANAHTPNLDKMNTTVAFTGGHTGTGDEQFTFSGPGWMTVLTGTWVDKHQVPNNLKGHRNKSRTVFNYIKEAKKDAYLASIVNWDAIHIFQENQIGDIDYTFDIGWDQAHGDDSIKVITSEAVSQIEKHGPDLLFVMYVNVDEVGHMEGFGPSYTKEIEKVDLELGELEKAIKTREAEHNEDWLIMVVTDHGRQLPDGRNHGGLSTAEKTAFIKMNKQGNKSFTTFVHEIPNTDNEGIYGYPSQASVVATVLRYLDIPIKEDWELAGSPLLGEEGPLRLQFLDPEKNELFWLSDSKDNAVIYKNGTKIGEVPAKQGEFKDEDTEVKPENGILRYVVSIDGSTEYISQKAD